MGQVTTCALLVRLALLFVVASFTATGAGAADRITSQKISGEILLHQRQKAPAVGVSEEEHLERLKRLGLNPDPESEICALYVKRRLRGEEVVELAARGVDVNSWAWVPPVPRKHPYGFYLARVRYSALPGIEADPRFPRLESLEFPGEWLNDLATAMVNIRAVQQGQGVPMRTGVGVKVAVADSGLDLSLADFPVPVEAFDTSSGESPADWSTDVSDPVVGHGTHVTGTAVGSGALSGGRYRGAAPGAELYFYKMGSFVPSVEAAIKSIVRASEVGCDVYSASWGFRTPYYDGSHSLCQAIDAAVANGMTCCVAAGNSGGAGKHFSREVGANATTEPFGFTFDNSEGSSFTFDGAFRVLWRGPAPEDSVVLEAGNLEMGDSMKADLSYTSPRGTKGKRFTWTVSIPAGESKTISLTLRNRSALSASLVHVYQTEFGGNARFDDADPGYTLGMPALADGTIAVGAWTSRDRLTNACGEEVDLSEFFERDITIDIPAFFSSLGPRVDGVRKPEVFAPGNGTVSCRDSKASFLQIPIEDDLLRVDNDSVNLNCSGPADYVLSAGTSMAAPLVSGAVALLLEADPALSPAQIKLALQMTAHMASAPETPVNYGLVDVRSAAELVAAGLPDDCDLQGQAPEDSNENGVPDVCEAVPPFRRGDANDDGGISIADPVFILNHLFGGGRTPACMQSADVNDDDSVNVADAVFVLNHLFAGGPAPYTPFGECGEDPTPAVDSADDLSCGEYRSC